MELATLAAQAGHRIDPATGAVAPPIYLSTTFERDADGSYPRGFVYSRAGNPNRQALEECLAQLEGGAAAAAFASGSAATAAVLQALAPGSHIIAPDDCYHGTRLLLREAFAPWGLDADFVDITDAAAVRAAVRPNTRLLWVETPSNPLLKVADIAELAGIAAAAGIRCACDHPWASPILQRPLALAAAARVRVFVRATSLGGTQSLIEHRASIEGPDTATPEDLLRLSIGVEHPDDLIGDLAQALG